MGAILKLLGALFMTLNSVGGLTSGIWLAIIGEWWAIGFGIAGFIAIRVLPLFVIPSLLFYGPAAILMKAGRPVLAFPLILLGSIYNAGWITAWCTAVLVFFMIQSEPASVWPLTIWSYVVATLPLAYMARKEQSFGPSASSNFTTFNAQISFIVVGVALLIGGGSLFGLGLLFAGIMGLGSVFLAFLVHMEMSDAASPQ